MAAFHKPGARRRSLARRRVAAILLAALLLAFASSPARAQWPNEPPGSTVLLDCAFDTPTCDGQLLDPYNSAGLAASPPSANTVTVVSDPTAPFSPTNVMRASLFHPNTQGGTELHYIAPTKINEIYVGFWWKVNPEFNGNVVNASKIFFVRGSIPGTNGVFLMRTNPGEAPYLYWTTQLPNNRDQCGSGPDVDICYPNVQSVPLTRGQWYRVEAYFKASSCDTCHDGIVRWWVNGTLSGDYQNFAYGPVLDTFVWSQTWDGHGNAMGFTADAHHYMDHLHISCPNGCPVSTNTGGSTSTGGGGGTSTGLRVVTRQAIVPRNATIPLKIVPKIPLTNVKIQVIGVFQEEGFNLTGGTYVGGGIWELTADDLTDLAIIPPPGYCGSINASVVITQNT